MKEKIYKFLRWSEHYTKTDMVYLANGGFWINLNTIIVTILSLLLSVEFAHLLSKNTYGTYQFVLSIASLISALTLTGMNTAVTQAVARGFEGTFKKSIRVQLLWGILPVAAGLLVSLYYFLHGNGELSISLIIVALLLPLWNAFNTYGAFFQGRKDFRSSFISTQFVNIAYYGGMLLALIFVQEATVLILINLGVNATVTGLLYLSVLRNHRPNSKEDPEAISYGKHLSLMNGFAALASPVDNIVVYHFLGAATLAIYAFASTVPERLTSATKSITQLALPKFSASDLPRIKGMIVRRTLQFTAVGFSIALIYIFFASFLFRWFFPQYLSSILYSQAYAIAAVLMISSTLPQTALFAVKAKRELYILNFLSPIIQVFLLITLGALYGIWGVIAARAIAGVLLLTLALFLVFSIKPARLTKTE